MPSDHLQGDPVQDWLTHLQQQGKSQHTLRAYDRALRHFAQWHQQRYGEAFALVTIMPRDVRDWKTYQQSIEKAAPRTINQRLVALSRFFRWLGALGKMQSNPTAEVKTIQLPVRQPRGISLQILRKLLRTVHQSGHLRNIAILEVLAGTGLRVGELLQLQVSDVKIGERAGSVIVRQGKQGHFREVPLTKDVRQTLRHYLETHPGKTDGNAALWLGTQGALQQRSSVLRILNKYALQAGLPPIHPHALRHTFATRYLAHNPGDLRGLASLLGHTSLETVLIYTEPSLSDLTERMERAEASD